MNLDAALLRLAAHDIVSWRDRFGQVVSACPACSTQSTGGFELRLDGGPERVQFRCVNGCTEASIVAALNAPSVNPITTREACALALADEAVRVAERLAELARAA
jgi:hypothetical protein